MKVLIPLEPNGLPMTLEDYFGELRDGGNPYFVGLTDEEILYKILPRDFVKTYLNYKRKVEAEQASMSTEAAERVLDRYIVKASRDGDTPLEVFKSQLETELVSLNVDPQEYLVRFEDEFKDDFEDEE
jgi:hypothetical protein